MSPSERPRFRSLGTFSVACVIAVASIVLPSTNASAEEVPETGAAILGTPGSGAAFGTGLGVVAFRAESFQPLRSSDTYAYASGRYVTASGQMRVQLYLPDGALIEGLDMNVCDTSPVGEVTLSLLQCYYLGAICSAPQTVTSGVTETPGCGLISLAIPPTLVNNASNSYLLSFSNSTYGGETKWIEARVHYRRQVSPSPAVETFADVPFEHPLHRYVEALVAAGITGGCGGGNFCPNDAVTRGQIAVFLAKALGLHWAP